MPAVPEICRAGPLRWQTRHHPEMQEYYRVKPQQRLIIGALYFGLAILLVLGMHATHVPRSF